MSQLKVRQALETALATLSPALDTVYENTGYEPVPGRPYQRVFLLPATTVNPNAGSNGVRRYQGVMQVSLFFPQNEGAGTAMARAELLEELFQQGKALVSSGQTVTIESTPYIGQAIEDGDRYMVPVRVRYFSNVMPA